MDGVRYLIGAFVVTDTSESNTAYTRVYSYNLTSFSTTEITNKAGWAGPAGNCRLTNTTNKVVFQVIREPRRYFFGAVKPARDVLMIQNGSDYPRRYDPRFDTGGIYVDVGQAMGVHKPLTLPTSAGQVRKVYRYARWLQVANATGTGRTYSKGTAGTFVSAETSAAPYNSGSNYCSKLTATNMGVNDYAAISYLASASFDGEQLVMILEGTVTQVGNILNNVKGEFSGGNTHVAVAGATSATPTVINAVAHGISTANNGTVLNQVYVHNISSVTDGFFFAKVIDADHFGLYSDVAATVGVHGTGIGASPYIISTPMYAFYDPSATGNDAQKRKYDIVTYDTANSPPRSMVIFYGLASIDSSVRTAFHLKFTRTTATVGTTTDTFTILMAASPSSKSFIAGSDFGVGYRDAQGMVIGPGFVCSSTLGEDLKRMGGPDTGLKLPSLGLVGLPIQLDYSVFLANTGTWNLASGVIVGGMDGFPTCCDIYAAYPVTDPSTGQVVGLSDYLWIQTQAIWIVATNGATKEWVANYTTAFIESATENWQFLSTLPARSQRDPVTPMPSAFCEAMPIGSCMAFADMRAFVGNLVEGGTTSPGDIAFSMQNQPYRFQTESTSDTDGGRAQLAGETVQAIVPLAAGGGYNPIVGIPMGAARVYAIGTSNFYGLGRSDAWSGQFYSDATSLSRPSLIGPHGTNEPYSVATYANQVFYVDQENQVVEFTAQGIASISRSTVDDKLKAIPATRRGAAQGMYFKDRYMLAYSVTGASTNTHVLGYSNLFRYWEFDDLLPGALNAESMVRFLDATLPGSGQRLFMAAQSGGALYAYDEGTAEYNSASVAVRITTRALEAWRVLGKSFTEIGMGFLFKWVTFLTDQVVGASMQVDRYYDPNGSQFRSTQKLDNGVVTSGLRFGDDTETAVSEVSATGQGEGGSKGYIDCQATVPGGTRILAIFAEIEPTTGIEKVGGV